MSGDPTYPLIDTSPPPERAAVRVVGPPDAPPRRGALGRIILWDLAFAVCLLHGWAIWQGMGGREGLDNGWPPWRNDHPLYYHSTLVTRSFLDQTGTTAGYDAAFMSGYPKSIVFPASSTLPELVVYFLGGERPERAYKLYVLASAAAIPWLILLAAAWLGAGAGGAILSVGLFLTYVWTDFPVAYMSFGMLPYLLAIPLGLIATAGVAGYVARGGFFRWTTATLASSLCVLVHFTSAMIVVPAALACYLAAIIRESRARGTFPVSRHLGVWLLPAVVLALNVFWWLPGIDLASTKGESDFAFFHPESVGYRLLKILATESPIEGVLIGFGLLGLATAIGRTPIAGTGLAVFAAMGFAWGYLAGFSRGLDFLQPGRHTYAFYSALAVSAGPAWSEVCRRLSASRSRLDLWATLGLAFVGFRLFGPAVDLAVSGQLARSAPMFDRLDPEFSKKYAYRALPEPFLSSRPSTRLLWVVDRVKEHVKPGERLLYEEGGKAVPGDPEPFDGGRFSGLLPERCGVEVIGGPYLHAALTTNFTQFGEGKLFEDDRWGRDQFVKYAKLYRPAAIVCWSRRAREFCKDHPDLVEIKDDDGRLLIGRVQGFEGWTIRGGATVEAGPNRLVVRDVQPDLDGLTVLRYHSAPGLRSRPGGLWEPVKIDGDPVPFIGVRPSPEPIVLELATPTPWGRRRP